MTATVFASEKMDPVKYPKDKKAANYIVIKTAGAMLFSVLGVMAFFCSVWYRNLSSAIFCFPLEIACIFILVFNKRYLKSELHLSYSAVFFRAMKYVSLFLCVAAWVATVIYIAVGFAHSEYMWYTPSDHLEAVPVPFFAGGACLVLFFDTKKYETLLESQQDKV